VVERESCALRRIIEIPVPAHRSRFAVALKKKGEHMLYTLAVLLIILWLLGVVSSYTMGGVIHVLLVIALVMVLVDLISGRSRV
jgi:hypothetical protein